MSSPGLHTPECGSSQTPHTGLPGFDGFRLGRYVPFQPISIRLILVGQEPGTPVSGLILARALARLSVALPAIVGKARVCSPLACSWRPKALPFSRVCGYCWSSCWESLVAVAIPVWSLWLL